MRDIEVLVTNESELECSRPEFCSFRGPFSIRPSADDSSKSFSCLVIILTFHSMLLLIVLLAVVHDDAAKVDPLGDDDVGVWRLLHRVDVFVLQHHQQRVKLLRGDFAIVALRHRVERGVVIVLQQTLNKYFYSYIYKNIYNFYAQKTL